MRVNTTPDAVQCKWMLLHYFSTRMLLVCLAATAACTEHVVIMVLFNSGLDLESQD